MPETNNPSTWAPWKRAALITSIVFAVVIIALVVMIFVLPPLVAPQSYNDPKYKNRNDDVSAAIGVSSRAVGVTPEQRGFFDPDVDYDIEAYLNGNIIPYTKLSYTKKGNDQIHADSGLNLNVGNAIGVDAAEFLARPVHWRFTSADIPQSPEKIYKLNPVTLNGVQSFFLQDLPGGFAKSDCYQANQGSSCSNAILTTEDDSDVNPIFWKFEFTGIAPATGEDFFKVYPVDATGKHSDTYLSYGFGDNENSDCKAAIPAPVTGCTNITIVDKIYDTKVPVYWIVRKA